MFSPDCIKQTQRWMPYYFISANLVSVHRSFQQIQFLCTGPLGVWLTQASVAVHLKVQPLITALFIVMRDLYDLEKRNTVKWYLIQKCDFADGPTVEKSTEDKKKDSLAQNSPKAKEERYKFLEIWVRKSIHDCFHWLLTSIPSWVKYAFGVAKERNQFQRLCSLCDTLFHSLSFAPLSTYPSLDRLCAFDV